MRRGRQREDWEDLAEVDLFWSILTRPGRRFGKWDAAGFLASGRTEIEGVIQNANRLSVAQRREVALDFGCGAGRLTRALSDYFGEVVGVDISPRMIAEARRLNSDRSNCHFMLNVTDDLRMFGDNEFDLVYTQLVLQHLPTSAEIVAYIAELARVLAPGGLLAFQVPTFIPWKHRIQVRRHAYRALKSIGVSTHFLYHHLNLSPMRMQLAASCDIELAVQAQGGKIVEVDTATVTGGIVSSTYWTSK